MRGTIILIGGAEDKTGKKEILQHVAGLNPGGSIAVIPTASGYAGEVSDDYQQIFNAMGVPDVHILDIRKREQAADPKFLEMIAKSDTFFFTGGDQEKLVDVLAHTPVIEKIREKFEQGATLAGTSAGATAIGNPMIIGGNAGNGFKKNYVTIKDGFGFLQDTVIDTHFMERCRIPRLCQVLSAGNTYTGIGLCEDTAAVVSPDGLFTVLGSRVVAVLNNRNLRYSNYHEINGSGQVVMDGISLSFIGKGLSFDLNKLAVTDSTAMIQ